MTRSTTALKRAALVTSAGALGFIAPATAAAEPPTCEALGGVVSAGVCTIDTQTPAYGIRATYPVGYPDQTALTDYLTQTRDGFVNVSDMPGSLNTPYELDVVSTEYRSGTEPDSGTDGVVFELYQNVGAAHPVTWFKAFAYDRATQAPLSFAELWPAGVDPMPALLPVVQRGVDRQLGAPMEIAPADGLDPAKFENFAVTDDAVVFFFGQGELLASAAGPISVQVPRDQLPPLAV